MATSPTIRQVLVDDTDAAIQYGPVGWFPADPSTLTGGNFGPIYNGTSSATTSNSNLTFAFNGTSILVQGTIKVATDANNATDPTWSCLVDGITIPSPDPTFSSQENNWPLCRQDTIASGSHVLTVQVTSKGRPFFLDSLVYTPPENALFESAVLIYPHWDPTINFTSGWKEDGEELTQTQNAQVTLSFHGTSASLLGHIPNQYPPNATSASYTIDGGAPVTFPLKGLASAQSSTQYNSLLFTTPTLSNGPHNLTVTHSGDVDHTPLVVKWFYVTNTTSDPLVSQQPVSSGTMPSPTSSSSPSITPISRSKTGAIVGEVVGSLILLALLAGLFVWRHRKRRRRGTGGALASAEPYSITRAEAGLHPGPDAETSTGYYSGTSAPRTSKRPGVHTSFARGAADIITSPTRSKGASLTPAPAVLQHQDSGVRLNGSSTPPTAGEVVELPPGYTPI
ncbi:hypothetical protein FB451DRAFT_145463 [Mycena latifolia]|nr:hypothetical protein FB451DRAFT_145463 [Mycena latifolia]